MKISIIGSGKIGGSIGKQWALAGHQVFFSSRNPEKLKSLLAESGPSAQAGNVSDAVAFGDVMLLAMPYTQSEAAFGLINSKTKKLLIDTRNPYSPEGKVITLPSGESATRQLAKRFPHARVVKAFNTIFWKIFADQHHLPGEQRFAVPIAGDDADALHAVGTLIEDAGFMSLQIGSIASAVAHELEPGGKLYGTAMTLAELKQAVDSI